MLYVPLLCLPSDVVFCNMLRTKDSVHKKWIQNIVHVITAVHTTPREWIHNNKKQILF